MISDADVEITEVGIIGAGIVGVCSALELLARGVKVTLIERSRENREVSYGNSGVVSPWSCVPMSMPGVWRNVPKWLVDPGGPLSIRAGYFPRFMPWGGSFLKNSSRANVSKISDAMAALQRNNIDLYRYHLSGTGRESLIRDSCWIQAYRNAKEANTDKLEFQLRKKRGAIVEAIDAVSLRRVEPALSEEFQAAVVIRDQARALSPGDVRQTLETKAARMGATLQYVSALRIYPSETGRWIVETTDGSLSFRRVLVCAGAWSDDLLRPLGISVPLERELGYHIECPEPGITLYNTVMDSDRKVVASSQLYGLRAASFGDFRGPEAELDFGRTKTLAALTKAMFPGLDLYRVVEWGGPRPSFPDSLPVIDAVPGCRGLYAAFGHSHFGFGMAPQTGRLISQLIVGENLDCDIAPYSITRF